MKKKSLPVLLLALMLALLVTGCGPAGDGSGSASSGEPAMVESAVKESGSVANESGRVEYSYEVPRLTPDTPGAAAINERISFDIGGYVAAQLEQIAVEKTTYLTKVTWHEYRNDALLSLVIKAEFTDTSLAYSVYNYNMKSGAEMDNAAVLAYFQIDPQVFDRELRRAVAQEFDRESLKMQEDAFDAVQLMRMDAINAANLSLNNVYLFAEEKQVKAVVTMPTPAAGGSDSKVVTPVFNPEQPPVEKTVERGFVTATLKDNAVTLAFKETETSGRYMRGGVEYNKPYTVEGLYNNYTDIFLGVLGQDFFPYLFLTDENGQVSFCNIMGSMNSGSRFLAAGPIRMPDAVVAYEDYNDGTANTALAMLKSGKQVDLVDYTVPVEQCVMLPLKASSWNSEGELSYWVDIHNGGDYPMIWGTLNSQETSNGWIAYVGMTEKGGVYRFMSAVPGKEKTGGYMTLARDSFNVAGHGEFWIEVSVATGQPLVGLEVGSTVKLIRSYG